jgi:adenosylcobinamide kinase/adenosylcobinamide-phosphate guanylyltransferase
MRITLLGTGSADGWPNPFCDCRSCASERAAGRSRRPSAALVDDVVLIDCGPTTPHGTGADLRAVENLLVTHGHPDHLQPAVLLARSWVPGRRPLHVWGPAEAMALCRDWIGPDAPVVLHVVAPGDELTLATDAGAYSARVLPAAHDHGNGDALAEEAVLYVVTAPDGHRLLYATDTGPLPATTVTAVGGRVDAVLLDETFGDVADHGHGHLDLWTLPTVLEALRTGGAIDAATTVVATHLSHHNPPVPELRGRLAALDVDLRDDLDVIDTAFAGGRAPRRQLVLGGARSGKSMYAEQRAARFGRVTYVATSGTRDGDPEWADRVALHRDRRPAHWATVETADLPAVLAAANAGSCVLVDCLTLWLTAVLDQVDGWGRAAAGHRTQVRSDVAARTDALLAALATCRAEVVMVSNEVGLGIVSDAASGRLFADELGRLNARVADACDDVTLLVAGRALSLEEGDR